MNGFVRIILLCFIFLKGKKDMDLHVSLCNRWTNCYWINTLILSLIFLNFVIDISLAVEDFECFLCPQGRDMEENLLPYGGELDYHIFKLSNAPRLARGGGMGTAGISLSHAMRPGLRIRHFWVAKSLFLTITFHQKEQDKTFCF